MNEYYTHINVAVITETKQFFVSARGGLIFVASAAVVPLDPNVWLQRNAGSKVAEGQRSPISPTGISRDMDEEKMEEGGREGGRRKLSDEEMMKEMVKKKETEEKR